MLTAILDNTGFRFQDLQVPEPASNEVLIKVLACGICGGDQHTFSRRKDLAGDGIRLGHEGTGTIVKIGDEVTAFSVGDVVTSLRGAFAEYFVSPADEIVKVPDNVDYRHALGEPIACCVHASWRFNLKKGDTVAVVGCGFMGLICMQLARIQGAGEVIAIDPVPYRRKMAMDLGADRSFDPAELPSYDPDEGLYDLVIEAAGVSTAIDLSSDLVKQHGRVCLVGYHENNDGLRTVNMQRWNYKAIDVVNGHVRRDDEKFNAMVEGMSLISQGLLNTAPLVNQFPLVDIAQAFDEIAGRQSEIFKIVLVPDNDAGSGG